VTNRTTETTSHSGDAAWMPQRCYFKAACPPASQNCKIVLRCKRGAD
jgi:hypothetical protein